MASSMMQDHAVSIQLGYQQQQEANQIQPSQIIQLSKDALQVQDVQVHQAGGIIHLSTAVPLQEVEVALESDKQSIYRHPLFPLMALLFEKCEQATQTPDCPTADSFDVDIQAFVHQQEQERKPFFSDEPELDNLMVKAIQVLRIHLLELEKVNDLCEDFCTRYISCLKGKLQSEQLLRVENDGEDTIFIDPSSLTGEQGVTQQMGNVVVQNTQTQSTNLNQGQIISGGTVYQMVQTPQGLVAQPIQIQTVPQLQQPAVTQASVIHGSTPLSQIGAPAMTTNTSLSSAQNLAVQNSFFDEDDDDDKKKLKRGVLPKQATQIMKSWLFQHIVHPYPTEDEKRQIAGQTNLTLLQVNNWFINARRRILQPMLDASNPDQTKVKKNRPQSRPLQRFWPDSIANITPQISADQSSGDGSQPGTPSSDIVSASTQLQVLSSQAALNQMQQSTQGQVLMPASTLIAGTAINGDISVKIEGLSPMLSQGSTQTILLSTAVPSDNNTVHSAMTLDNSDNGSSLGD